MFSFILENRKQKPKTKTKKNEIKADSGSTKADWIAIDDNGSIVYNTNFGEILKFLRSGAMKNAQRHRQLSSR
jgi:activator of 2-hydroxyglutaryl-CoA dehydratase